MLFILCYCFKRFITYKIRNYFKCAEVQSIWRFYFPSLHSFSGFKDMKQLVKYFSVQMLLPFFYLSYKLIRKLLTIAFCKPMKLPSLSQKVKYFMFKHGITEFVIKIGIGHTRLKVFLYSLS